jgi:hypothetical protein
MLQSPLQLIKLPNVVVQFNINTTPTFHLLMLPAQGHLTKIWQFLLENGELSVSWVLIREALVSMDRF